MRNAISAASWIVVEVRDLSAFATANLRRLRTERGYSQRELADRSGLNQARINDLEHGKRRWTLEFVAAVAAGLGVDPSVLIMDPASPPASVEALLAEIAMQREALKFARDAMIDTAGTIGITLDDAVYERLVRYARRPGRAGRAEDEDEGAKPGK